MTVRNSEPKSPGSPVRKRHSLQLPSIHTDYDPPSSPNLIQNGFPDRPSHSRRTSQSSFHQFSPRTPRPTASRSKRPSSSRLSIGSNISAGLASNAGLGNLADELEEAWDHDLDEPAESFLDGLQEGDIDEIVHSPVELVERHTRPAVRPPESPTAMNNLLHPPDKPPSPSKQWASMGTHQKTESLYDGSDYGPSSDDEAFDSIAPTLQRRIHDIEEITRISTNADSFAESGGVIARTTAMLRDNLGAQSLVESDITRLITAYTSLGTHRVHQTRELTGAFYTLGSSTYLTSTLFQLPPETTDLILAELDSLLSTLPFLPDSPIIAVQSNPLAALQVFAANSHELVTVLHSLADTLTENRQHLLTATRRLKTARDLVEELRMEEDLVETSILLIQAGDWDRRCRERHAAKAVGEVLDGFRKTWDVDYTDGAWTPWLASRREVPVR